MISSRFTALPAAAIALAAAACGGGSGARDATVGDATVGDATIGDATVGDATLGDATLGDATVGDGAREDASLDDAAPLDAAPLDAAPLDAAPLDAAPLDAAPLDAAPLDAAPLDAAPLDAAPAPPCASGPGRVLWRLSFPPNHGGYATVDAWAAACAYSLADPACSLSGEPHDYASFGPGVVFNSTTDYFRVRWSVAGMAFTQATLYLAAHADGGGLPRLAIQSQLHGDFLFQPTVPISTHRLYAIDWTPYLTPADAPSLTAITLRPMPTGVAVSLLELCVQ
ncbi:MAG: hypothetical protein R3B06_29750 [Kofleriaceae bacterium]